MRVSELDSVRGVAAFVVLLHHLWMVILPDQNTFPLTGYPIPGGGALATIAFWISVTPLRLLFCGHSAVGVFFVLSGFALMKALENPQQRHYTTFITRRFFRIYPPFATAILGAAALSWLLQPQPLPTSHWPALNWVNAYWTAPVTIPMVLGHLGMISTAGYYNSLNSAMWTLVHEMRISVLFPLIAAAAVARPRWVLIAGVSLFIVFSITHLTLSIAAHLQPPGLADFFLSILQTLRYVLFFVLGILVVTQATAISAFLGRHSGIKPVLWVTAAILLAIPYTKGYTELAYAVGSFLLLNLCLNSDRARALLRNPVLQWLGRVSYSLYLTHLVVLLALVYTLYNVLPMWLILLLVLTVSLVTAEIFNRWIEMPSARLGKRMAGRVRPATAQQSAA